MFYSNLNAIIKGNTIIANSNRSTPGVYKIFTIDPTSSYTISLKEFNKGTSTKLFVWIATLSNQLIKSITIDDTTVTEYQYVNANHSKIKIGILFRSPHITDYFKLDDIIITKQNSTINSTITKNINIKNGISVIIPCHYKHFAHLDRLLKTYDEQTLLPNEIIIVISEVEHIPNDYVNRQLKQEHKYELNIIKVRGKSAAGNNRYIGTKSSKYDIIVFQDADDFPHKQRLEIINHYFTKFPDIVHICHKFDYEDVSTQYSDIDKIDTQVLTNNKIFSVANIRILSRVTNGNIAIRKTIYDKLNWYKTTFRGQDVKFNCYTFAKYKKTLFIKVPLYYYRKLLSVKKFVY